MREWHRGESLVRSGLIAPAASGPGRQRAVRGGSALLLVITAAVAGLTAGVVSSVLAPAQRADAASPGKTLFADDFRGGQVSAGSENLLITNGTFTPCLTASTNTAELPVPGCPTTQPGGATGTLPDAPGDGALRLTS